MGKLMLQICILVVVINTIMGIILTFDRSLEESMEVNTSFIHNTTFTLTLSILALIVSLSSLVAPYGVASGKEIPFSMLPVLGDLFASIATALGCLSFLARYIKTNHPSFYAENSFFEMVEANERFIGVTCLTMAILHFLFPQILFV